MEHDGHGASAFAKYLPMRCDLMKFEYEVATEMSEPSMHEEIILSGYQAGLNVQVDPVVCRLNSRVRTLSISLRSFLNELSRRGYRRCVYRVALPSH